MRSFTRAGSGCGIADSSACSDKQHREFVNRQRYQRRIHRAAPQPGRTDPNVGNRLLPEMVPYATCYGGHQFGNWAGQLGDGRAINLGEVVTPASGRQVLQLPRLGLFPDIHGDIDGSPHAGAEAELGCDYESYSLFQALLLFDHALSILLNILPAQSNFKQDDLQYGYR